MPRISSDPQPGPRYVCRLCDMPANLPNMVHHVIGRKHRVKYMVSDCTHFQDTLVVLLYVFSVVVKVTVLLTLVST